jgi:hypothetical protein
MFSSCNAHLWGVQETAQTPQYSGLSAPPYDYFIQFYAPKDIGTWNRVMRSAKEGVPWTWSHGHGRQNAQIWVLRESDDSIAYTWEGEDSPDYTQQTECPIIDRNVQKSALIPSGGSAVLCRIPSLSDLQSIESDVLLTDLPAWIENSDFEGFTTTESLLSAIFRVMQNVRGYRIRGDIDSVFSYTEYIFRTNQVLLWLRAASMILYDHQQETAIPVIENKFTCDQYGNLTAI